MVWCTRVKNFFGISQGMREVQLNSHTLRSHGTTVARTHMHDWLILILLIVIVGILDVIHPFHRFVGKDMMSDLKYPLKPNTVPAWAIPIYAILLPIIIFTCFYFRRKDVYDLHHAVLGLLFSVLVTAVITTAIKDAVGRPRPDFFWRCFPDGKDVYDQLGDVICNGKKNVIKEGYKSFPSGHTSGSFAGLGFLSLYLAGKIKAFDRRGHVAKLCIVLFPLLVAALVGVSRVDDYWHHWQDVFAGGLLGIFHHALHFVDRFGASDQYLWLNKAFVAGFVVATLCYLQFFPPPYHPEGWGPYAYFRMLEESRMNVEAQNGQVAEAQLANQSEGRNGHGCMGLHLGCNTTSTLEDEESGPGGR